jgi:hypothetical protein
MASVFPPDPEVAARRRGLITGVVLAIAATLAAYGALWLPTSTAVNTAMWTLFLGPLATGLVLLCIPKTRSLANGLLTGVVVTWIVSVPACVVVSLSTVPNILG